jgi:drug/metabolite transporter (DMT)-like permease
VSDSNRGLIPYLALVGLALIWGVSFFFIKVAVHDMSPVVLVLFRSVSATIALAAIVRFTGRPLFGEGWRSRVIPFAILGITGGLLPWAGIAWGETRISSGLASILNSTTPLWTAVLVYWVIPSDRPSPLNYVGVLIGLAGVVILVVPDLATKGIRGSALGALAVVLASLAYAVNALYLRRKMRRVSVYEAALGQLAATAVLAIPFAAPSLPSVHFALASMAAVIALGVGGSAIGLLLYFYIMKSLGPVQATGVTLLVPVTAVIWGAILLREVVTVPIIIGMVVILTGIVLTNVRARKPKQVTEKEPAAA